jgi:hypothetical protein
MARTIESYPLSWPAGWKRTAAAERKHAQFGRASRTAGSARLGLQQLTVIDAADRVLYELGRLGIDRDDIVISTDIPTRLDGLPRSKIEPRDPGAAVYWRQAPNQPVPKCMAIDVYDRVADNLAAIAATLEAMRAIERHGGAEILERVFLGFQALPAPGAAWWEVLEFDRPVTLDLAEKAYRDMAKKHHPDKGGSREQWDRINRAIATARAELGGEG